MDDVVAELAKVRVLLQCSEVDRIRLEDRCANLQAQLRAEQELSNDLHERLKVALSKLSNAREALG